MGCKIFGGDFFVLSRSFFFFSFFFFCFMDLKLTHSSSLFFYLYVEWQEVTKGFRPVKLGVGGVFPGKRLLQVV